LASNLVTVYGFRGSELVMVDKRKVTLPPAQRAYGPEGTVNSEPVNGCIKLYKKEKNQ
jgi:hypothetical protein